MQITLKRMTRQLCHRIFREWENDPAIYADLSEFHPYRYDADRVDRYFDRKQEPSRILFAIMNGEEPIGELQLKKIDPDRKECTLSIHLKNDSVKGRGFGTQAEKLAVEYAFRELGMNTVLADTVLKNLRSRHVLEKVGFRFFNEEGAFRYYRIDREIRE